MNGERGAPSAADQPVQLLVVWNTRVSSARLPAGDREAGSGEDEKHLASVANHHFVLLHHHRDFTFTA
jgi:hypothetical protein